MKVEIGSINLERVAVRGIVYMDPPVPDAQGAIVPDFGWVSGVEEKLQGLTVDKYSCSIASRIIAAKMTELGPEAVIEMPLSKVLWRWRSVHSVHSWRGDEYEVCGTSVCSTVAYDGGKTIYLGGELPIKVAVTLFKKAEITYFQIMNGGGGCNPGTLLVFPGCKMLNDALYYAKLDALKEEENPFNYVHSFRAMPRPASSDFPEVDFSCNAIIRKFYPVIKEIRDLKRKRRWQAYRKRLKKGR